jgi:hypothetical protein
MGAEARRAIGVGSLRLLMMAQAGKAAPLAETQQAPTTSI